MTAYRLAPWTQIARPHDDVLGAALDMGTYAANLAGVFRSRPGIPPVYLDAHRFFEATYLTQRLEDLLRDVLRVLGGGDGDRVLQLRTPFGGGKTHTLLALLHLTRDRQACASASEQIAKLPDPGPVRVAVLSGEELDPLSPMTATGIETRTLWGELAAQLGCYQLLADHDREGSAPGGDVLRRVLGEEPVLILLDEVLVYVEKARAVARGDSTAGRQAMLFIQALTETVNAHPHAAMVYSLQASVGEAVGAEGLLSDLDKLVARIDAKREPVSDAEVSRVVQKRLFAGLGDPEVHREVARAYADLHGRQLQAAADTEDARREALSEAALLEQRILDTYPFHPALLDLMYHRWGSLPSYQRTRGALQFLASTIHALWEQRSSTPLIGPGDVDLADEATRGSFFGQVGERERYASVLASDITSDGSGAKIVDRRLGADSPTVAQLAVGTRVSTAVILYSFGAREGEDAGVLEGDLTASVLTPGLDRNIVLAALHELREEALYLHYTGRRYRYEPRPNLTKLIRDEANKYTPAEILDRVRSELEAQLRGARGVLIWPTSPAAVDDERPLFTVAYLHPDWSPDRTPLGRFVEDARNGPRRYRNALALVLPDAGQFDQARASTRQRLAAQHLLGQRARYGFNPDQVEELREKADTAARDVAAALSRAYASVAVPVRTRRGDAPYALDHIDLRSLLTAGRALHERITDALGNRVFASVTVDKLVSLAGVGQERRIVSCADVVDGFFRYFDFTKIWDSRVVAEAISRAVMEERLGYAVGLVSGPDGTTVRDPRRVRLGDMIPVEELDLSQDAALIDADLARELLKPEPPPAPDDRGADEPDGDTTARPGPGGTGPQPEPQLPRPDKPLEPSADRTGVVQIDATVTGDGLFNLIRALTWLRDENPTMELRLSLRAERTGGFDKVTLRNRLLEPLEEGSSSFNLDLE
jgi:hypothetical protein